MVDTSLQSSTLIERDEAISLRGAEITSPLPVLVRSGEKLYQVLLGNPINRMG